MTSSLCTSMISNPIEAPSKRSCGGLITFTSVSSSARRLTDGDEDIVADVLSCHEYDVRDPEGCTLSEASRRFTGEPVTAAAAAEGTR